MSRLDLIQTFGLEKAETFNKISHAYELGRADEREKTIEMLEREFAKQNKPNSKFKESIVLKRDFLEQINQLN